MIRASGKRNVLGKTWLSRRLIPPSIVTDLAKVEFVITFFGWHDIDPNWSRYSANSSICVYLSALIRNSSRSDVGFLQRLLTKGLDRNAVIKWCMTIGGSKFRIFKVIFQKYSMKVRNGSFFSCPVLTRVIKVRWWGRLVANCVPKWAVRVLNESTELRGSYANQWKACPFSDVGNTW